MKLDVNPPTPWPNWQATASTRKTRPTIMGRAVEEGPWALVGLPFSVWTGACYWHGVGGPRFNSSSAGQCVGRAPHIDLLRTTFRLGCARPQAARPALDTYCLERRHERRTHLTQQRSPRSTIAVGHAPSRSVPPLPAAPPDSSLRRDPPRPSSARLLSSSRPVFASWAASAPARPRRLRASAAPSAASVGPSAQTRVVGGRSFRDARPIVPRQGGGGRGGRRRERAIRS